MKTAFDKNGIKKHFDIDRLVKARPLDNLEFVLWMKAFFDSHYNAEAPYNALERRKQQDLFYIHGSGANPEQKMGVSALPTEKKPLSKAVRPQTASRRQMPSDG